MAPPRPPESTAGRSGPCRGRRECRACRSASRGRTAAPRSARISAWPSAIVHAQMRGAGREIGVVQIIGLYARLDEGAHQRLQRLDVVVDAFEQHALADQHDARVGEAPAGGARLSASARADGWRAPRHRRSCRALGVSARASAVVTRSGAATGRRVCQRSTLTWGIAASARVTSAMRRGDSASGSPPVRMTSQISRHARARSRAPPRTRPRQTPVARPDPSRGGSKTGNRPRRPRRA